MKQRALLNKYPDPAQFILDYNPDLQFKLVRCNATHSELALNDSIPSLGLLSSTYGDETPIEWLKIQFGSLNDFAEVSTKIAKEQLSELSEIFLSEYYYINAAEICFFIARFKSGKYGRFYGSIDPLKITSAMLDYVSERRKDIERKERERYRNQRQSITIHTSKLLVYHKDSNNSFHFFPTICGEYSCAFTTTFCRICFNISGFFNSFNSVRAYLD